ncbi:homoserine dehydrogenase [Virgibacillus kekensis]|uniref:Homoserine dehydrogenase n=1 Tax=Virgibacillus kekensis TaxID=202261 RepID=A0ABV9DFY1_9BACI
MEKEMVVGLLGFGTVGSGVHQLIEAHQDELVHKLGRGVKVKRVLVYDLQKAREVQVNPELLTNDASEILNDPEIGIVIEVMGGIEQARNYILRAFEKGKHVVTANKDLMALHGPELQSAALENGCDLYYEASVAGGIPIIRGIEDGLVPDRIESIMGIVNGTTNYILTKMDDEGVSYEAALKEAQELGFAEADPAGDVGGMDAARKMAIMARLAFSIPVDLADVEVQGIEQLALDDLQFGKQLGLTMKLIGRAHFQDNRVELSVEPAFLPNTHPLAAVKNENNAVYVYGKAMGETMFYGPGAGSLPTATAVLSDTVAVIRNMILGVNGKQVIAPRFEKVLKEPEQRNGQYYFRLQVQDRSGTFTVIASLFNKLDISFERILQNPVNESDNSGLAEIIVVTHQTTLDRIDAAREELEKTEVVTGVKSCFRIEGGLNS